MARKALDEMPVGVLQVLVSLEVQMRNLVQLAEGAGWPADAQRVGDHFLVTIRKTGPAAVEPQAAVLQGDAPSVANATFVFGSDELGHGEPDLGRLLLQLMVRTLADGDPAPRRLIFLNTGVRLVCEGSPILDALRALEDKGVDLLACGTCLDYLGLLDLLRAGHVSNMHDIVGFLTTAGNLITAT
jgi:selenium metabolism protein YedF